MPILYSADHVPRPEEMVSFLVNNIGGVVKRVEYDLSLNPYLMGDESRRRYAEGLMAVEFFKSLRKHGYGDEQIRNFQDYVQAMSKERAISPEHADLMRSWADAGLGLYIEVQTGHF